MTVNQSELLISKIYRCYDSISTYLHCCFCIEVLCCGSVWPKGGRFGLEIVTDRYHLQSKQQVWGLTGLRTTVFTCETTTNALNG